MATINYKFFKVYGKVLLGLVAASVTIALLAVGPLWLTLIVLGIIIVAIIGILISMDTGGPFQRKR